MMSGELDNVEVTQSNEGAGVRTDRAWRYQPQEAAELTRTSAKPQMLFTMTFPLTQSCCLTDGRQRYRPTASMSKRSQLSRDSHEVEIVNVLYQRVPSLIYRARITCAENPSSDRGY